MEKNRRAGYEQIRAALKGRNYTVFSKHLHCHVKAERDGMKHYELATAGGDSKVRGKEAGEFDHVTWVAMKIPAGPVVVNLRLDACFPDNVVTEEMLAADRRPARRQLVAHRPQVVRPMKSEFKQLIIPLRFANPTNFPLCTSMASLRLLAETISSPLKSEHIVAPGRTDTAFPTRASLQAVWLSPSTP